MPSSRRSPAPSPHSYYAAVPPTSPSNARYVSSYSTPAAPGAPTLPGGPRASRPTSRQPPPPSRTPSRQSRRSRSSSNGSRGGAGVYRSNSSDYYHPSSSQSQQHGQPRAASNVYRGVATGQIGNAYGPYSYETQANERNASRPQYQSQYSIAQSSTSMITHEKALPAPGRDRERQQEEPQPGIQRVNTSTVPAYMWDTKDPDLDDAMHNPDPARDAYLDRRVNLFSARGWMNAGAIFLIMAGLVGLFAGYPIAHWASTHHRAITGFNLGGINASGQIPSLPGLPTLIDAATPSEARTRVGTDGKTYSLVFSDEFEVDGRTFWPGDDPFWTGVDLHYWPTGDLEWYNPQAITTSDGSLVITMTEQDNHNLNFQSGMLQSWNQFCFTTGYIEVSVSMPGTPKAPGLWPAIWTMGNLGRAGYGATTEGLWPYSYDSCDLGTFPNQTTKAGQPSVDATGGTGGSQLSFLPGQRLSACTCPDSDHPGPSYSVGRAAPEIDIFETQVDTSAFQGEVSQSLQTAPYNFQYISHNSSSTIYDADITKFNTYMGGQYQQAVSAVTAIDATNYNNNSYATYGFEWWSDPSNRDDGYVTWFSEGNKAWTVTAPSIGADSTTQISKRLIPEEPAYIIMNLGMSPSFQAQDFEHLTFPVSMYVDYVRVYQRDDVNNVGCDTKTHPTANYINKHIEAYTNPNLTTWAQANFTFPRNSLYDGCF